MTIVHTDYVRVTVTHNRFSPPPGHRVVSKRESRKSDHWILGSTVITLLDEIQKRLELANIPSCKYVGETSKKKKLERDELSKKSKIILTTRAMAAEGFDRPGISA